MADLFSLERREYIGSKEFHLFLERKGLLAESMLFNTKARAEGRTGCMERLSSRDQTRNKVG
jgi:hypothetical protein